MLLVVRFWEEFDENRDLARRIVGVFLLVVFRPALSTCSTGPRRKVHTVRALRLDGRRVSERAFTLRRRRRENLRSRRLLNMYIAATDTLL